MKQSPSPMFNWELPDVEMPPDDGSFPVLTAEQWVVWFRTLPTFAQIEAAKSILELQAEDHSVQAHPVRYQTDLPAQELADALSDIKDSCRLILTDTKGMKPQKKRAALLAERVTAIGVAIKGMGL